MICSVVMYACMLPADRPSMEAYASTALCFAEIFLLELAAMFLAFVLTILVLFWMTLWHGDTCQHSITDNIKYVLSHLNDVKECCFASH